jgi:Chaperone of endosialidase
MNLFRLKNSNSTSHKFNGRALLLVAFGLACFAPPTGRAVVPPPDGGYPNFNTAEGEDALFSLTNGSNNTAIGYRALYHNLGDGLFGCCNTAVGEEALFSNTTGFGNTAIGIQALFSNTTSQSNTAIGLDAMRQNTTGGLNVAIGADALFGNTTGRFNVATGVTALNNNSTGNNNVANGNGALLLNSTGSNNIAVGRDAGQNLTTSDNNIDIGNEGVAGEANTIRIGTEGTQTRTFVAGIHGTPIGLGLVVRVNASGQLGTIPSSERFKTEVKPIDKASEAIHALKPVTFRYKQEIDPEGVPQFGLVAEHVEKVNPDLVVRDKEGKSYTVRYEAVNAMLLNEFLKEHRKVEQLKEDFESKVAEQQKQIEVLTAGLQKVSAQLEVNKSAPRTVGNN